MNWTLSKPAFFYFKDWKNKGAFFIVFKKKKSESTIVRMLQNSKSLRPLAVLVCVFYLSCISFSLKKHFAHVSASW